MLSSLSIRLNMSIDIFQTPAQQPHQPGHVRGAIPLRRRQKVMQPLCGR